MVKIDEAGPAPVILLTVRPAESDFRLHLARELQALGHPVTYIFLKRRPVATDLATGRVERWSLRRLFGFFAGLRRRRPRPVVFNSTNLAFPMLSIALRRLSGVPWCLDMHDDLLYNMHGARRTRALVAQRLLVAGSDMIVHAAPTLGALFPRSIHIGNATSMVPLAKTREDPWRVLVMSSLDGRFDFPLMAAAARTCGGRRFEIYGRISQDDPAIAASLDTLVATHPNVTYHGPYTDDDLPALLARYVVAFAPYKVGDRLTDYIDPLRFYHCLAARTGLVSTAIPQAARMRGDIEVLDDVATLDAALDRATARRETAHARTWREVAGYLGPLLTAAARR